MTTAAQNAAALQTAAYEATLTPKPTKQKHKAAYTARIAVKIPLDMANAATLTGAVDAVAKIKDGLPAGSTVEILGIPSFGKMPA